MKLIKIILITDLIFVISIIPSSSILSFLSLHHHPYYHNEPNDWISIKNRLDKKVRRRFGIPSSVERKGDFAFAASTRKRGILMSFQRCLTPQPAYVRAPLRSSSSGAYGRDREIKAFFPKWFNLNIGRLLRPRKLTSLPVEPAFSRGHYEIGNIYTDHIFVCRHDVAVISRTT